jgi:hypothetical protein
VLATNIITTDTFSVSVITTNLNAHHTLSTNTTNFRTTVSSTNAPGTNVVTLGTAIGIDVAGTTVTGTNTAAIAELLGVSLQGSSVFGVSPLNTDQLGTNTLDHGLHVSSFAATNAAGATLTVPDIAGAAFTNAFDAADLDLPSSFTNLEPGIEVVITNILHVEAAVSHVPQGWSAVAASADGSRLVGAVNGGLIYLSLDSGAHWTATQATITNWSAVAISADGTHLAAFARGGLLSTSSDLGATWSVTGTPAFSRWCAVALSSDGGTMAALTYQGPLYIGQGARTPLLNISPSNGGVLLAWPASPTTFEVQTNSSLEASGWADAQTATNGQCQVILPVTTGQRFYRLRRE